MFQKNIVSIVINNNVICNLLSFPFMSYTPWRIFVKSKIIQYNKVRFDDNLKVGEDTNVVFTIMALSSAIPLLPIIGYNYIMTIENN